MAKKKPTKTPPPTPSKPRTISNSPMDTGLLEELVKLMSANDLNTVDLRDGEKRVVLRRGPRYVAGAAAAPVSVAAPAASTPAPSAPAASASASPAAAASDDAGTVAIKSPMVGTFYAAPSPDAKPFVAVGTVVDEDTDVCVIEAMKVFNNIKAETKGTIAKILVNNGQTVEYGQVLFLVKPA
ncbi:MAG TPA: acetyl-CoA carboxylase biotin carboxyl carrier protein [Tepidisphaeraceae bacterium]|nr:acetyl-CoA carboxylase biotin carboxyl carrier protein [Tepidisphaeraceae bacterium]